MRNLLSRYRTHEPSEGSEEQPRKEPDFIKVRNVIAEEAGPADIVFGPDMFDPRIVADHAPYTEAYMQGVDQAQIKLPNGHNMTVDDLDKSAAEVFPGVTDEELPHLLLEHVVQLEPLLGN